MFNLFKKTPKGEELILNIEGMHCTSCAINIDGALEDTDGVFSAETSYARAVVKINFDAKKISEKELRKIVESEGYKVA